MAYKVELADDGHMVWPPIHTDTGKRLMESSQTSWRKILQALATKGNIHDKSGLASVVLAKRIKWKFSSGALVGTIGKMQDAGLVTRETRGRRTFVIELTVDPEAFPVEWLPSENGHGAPATVPLDATDAVDRSTTPDEAPDAVEATTPATNGHVDLVAVEAPDTDAWMASVLDNGGVDYQLLATALLERLVDVVTNNNGTDEDTYDRATVLSVQLTHANNQADKLRNRINVLERDIAIGIGRVKVARAELAEERRLHAGTEANLRRMMDLARSFNANASLDSDKRNALEKMLREIPISPTTQRNIT